ncbi:MAG: hypothetical protein M3R39_09760 [Actinomycetota bacterium]|nr:hypothetical protein [Actinomycetota bacterium]
MSALEQRLHRLGQELEYPSEPDVAPGVLARLERRPPAWRPLVVALAVLVVAVTAAFAVPQARTTILKWFHLRGATVERVETLPPAVERRRAGGLGRSLSRADAEREVGFRLVLPPFEGPGPSRVYVLDRTLATVIAHAYGRSLLLSEYRAADFGLLKKSATGKTVLDSVRVDGDRGLWLAGSPHTLTYFNRRGEFQQRTVLIRGNVLLWVHDGLTLRLEGKLTRAQALALARRIR